MKKITLLIFVCSPGCCAISCSGQERHAEQRRDAMKGQSIAGRWH